MVKVYFKAKPEDKVKVKNVFSIYFCAGCIHPLCNQLRRRCGMMEDPAKLYSKQAKKENCAQAFSFL